MPERRGVARTLFVGRQRAEEEDVPHAPMTIAL
jgi:hypothetical protein